MSPQSTLNVGSVRIWGVMGCKQLEAQGCNEPHGKRCVLTLYVQPLIFLVPSFLPAPPALFFPRHTSPPFPLPLLPPFFRSLSLPGVGVYWFCITAFIARRQGPGCAAHSRERVRRTLDFFA